jgi:putative transposase
MCRRLYARSPIVSLAWLASNLWRLVLSHRRNFCRTFFPWYNTKHRHQGIALLTPEIVHYGRAETVIAARQEVLQAAYAAHPERFVHKPPTPSAIARSGLDQSPQQG